MTSPSGYVYGKHSVLAVLETQPRRVSKLWIAEGQRPDKRLQAIWDLAKRHGLAIQQVPRVKLDRMLDGQTEGQKTEGEAHHQGVVASVAPREFLSLEALIAQCKPQLEAKQPCLLLMLDEVTDPRNVGAILRVADAAGVAGVILPKHRGSGLSPAVAKTACGAEETVPLAMTGNLSQAVEKLKKAGFWVMGAANTPQAVDYHRQDYGMPLVLVLGNEETGIRPLLLKHCDFVVRIPMRGRVESLNVATAAAVLVFQAVKSGS